ncbi:carboxymuconolactone decarboxylase family protein [Planctomicrobium sp. SH527]|uniref:carboxymuconolactone decarboxylase family protein n=1 Tax=Planctomicrobium sp. SH527 TaxID=3448123 RepID=UPI003F5B1DE5
MSSREHQRPSNRPGQIRWRGDRPSSDEVFEQARGQFSDQELGDLIWVIATINSWNRVSIGFGSVPGSYQSPNRVH